MARALGASRPRALRAQAIDGARQARFIEELELRVPRERSAVGAAKASNGLG